MKTTQCGRVVLWGSLAVACHVGPGSGSSSAPELGDVPGLSDSGDSGLATPVTADDLRLFNLLVNFAPFDENTGRAGDFDFAGSAGYDKLFLEFGAQVLDGAGESKILPTFELRVPDFTEVMVPVTGTITRLVDQGNGDMEIGIQRTAEDPMMVMVDHVYDVTVSKGDLVTGGDLLGTARSTVELMVVEDRQYYCPWSLFDEAGLKDAELAIVQHMADWEAFKGDETVWDEAAMKATGCRAWVYCEGPDYSIIECS